MTWSQAYNDRIRTPLPRDWHEMAPKLTCGEAVAHYKVGVNVVRRWARITRITLRKPPRPSLIPEWFVERAHEGSAEHWAAMFGVTANYVRNYARSHGAHTRRMKTGMRKGTKRSSYDEPRTHMPPQWPQRASQRTAKEWSEVLGVAPSTTRRWARTVGVSMKPGRVEA